MAAHLEAWRRDFPALAQRPHGHRLAYLDSASTTLKPQAVIDAVTRVFTHDAGNVGRGVHALAEAATAAFEDARAAVAAFLGARPDEIVFTRGATESINLVAHAWGRAHVGPGDAVIVTALEHHANLVPWQRLCAERGATLRIAPIDEHGHVDLAALTALLEDPTRAVVSPPDAVTPPSGPPTQTRVDSAANGRVRLVAVSHLSNVLGTIAPIAAIARAAHAAGALVLVDGAQAVAHLPVDVAALGADFYAFSGHKLYAPPGTGVLWARRALLDAMPPWQSGGEMVAAVDFDTARYRDPPHRFEAGTPNIAGVIGLGAALGWLAAHDRAALAAHEAAVHAHLVRSLAAVPGVRLVGAPDAAVAAFTVDGVHPHDVATIVDREGVAIRSGHHCAQPLHRHLGLDASARASLALYSGTDDVDQLCAALARVRDLLG